MDNYSRIRLYQSTKFLSLPLERQHKKCAELIHLIYEQKIQSRGYRQYLETYYQLIEWMKEPLLTEVSLKSLADRYHWHLRKAGLSKREHHLLPPIRKGDRTQTAEPWPIAIYLDHLRSAHNVGSILRTVEAFALGTVYFSPDTPSYEHSQVLSTSMGAAEWVQCRQGVPLDELPKPIVALETSEAAISLDDFLFPNRFTLVVGNEEYGCSDATLRQADYLVEIPLRGRKNSLNVANALAIAAREIQRQRTGRGNQDQKKNRIP